jgi:integrase
MSLQNSAQTGVRSAKRAARGQGSVKLVAGYWRATFVPTPGHPKVTLRSAHVSKKGLQRHALERMATFKADFARLGHCPDEYGCKHCGKRATTTRTLTGNTVGDWVRHWLAVEINPECSTARRVDITTYDCYTSAMTYHVLSRDIAKLRLRDLSRDDVEAWWHQMEADKVGPAARKKTKRVLGSCLSAAVERRERTGLQYNPAHAFKLAPERGRNKKNHPTPDPEDERTLLQAAHADDADGIRALIVTFGHRLGMRRQEILGLQFGDFDLANLQVKIQRRVNRVRGLGVVVRDGVKWGSPKSFRLMPIDPIWVDRLQRQRTALLQLAHRSSRWTGADPRLPSAYLFPNSRGEVWDPRACSKWFSKAVTAAGQSKGMHQMRHDFCGSQVLQGTPIAKIAALAGHSDIATTMGYIHISANHLREEPGRFERFWAADGTASA